MTSIAIFPEEINPSCPGFLAIAGNCHSYGKTAGEALDAITAQMGGEAAGTLVVVQHMRGDSLFSEEQRKRLVELMQNWRDARDLGTSLTPSEQSELQNLVDAELSAATERATKLAASIRN